MLQVLAIWMLFYKVGPGMNTWEWVMSDGDIWEDILKHQEGDKVKRSNKGVVAA